LADTPSATLSSYCPADVAAKAEVCVMPQAVSRLELAAHIKERFAIDPPMMPRPSSA
jgi:hypothetical protein